jgi:hypothetical protein
VFDDPKGALEAVAWEVRGRINAPLRILLSKVPEFKKPFLEWFEFATTAKVAVL